jgi:dTDP-glucose pyrophosphorylase
MVELRIDQEINIFSCRVKRKEAFLGLRLRTGIIPAAGLGQRMGNLGDVLPKSLFPLFDRPILHHVIDNMIGVGIERIIIVVHHQKEKIIKYLRTAEIDAHVEIVEPESLPKGIALSIASAEDYVSKPFMTILGDDVTLSPSLDNLVSCFFDKKALALQGVVKEPNKRVLSRTCCLDLGHGNRIIDVVEKPSNPSGNYRGCGVYVFRNDIFDLIRQTPVSGARNEVEISDTIKLAAKLGKAYAEFINGINVNVNTKEDILRAWQLWKNMRDRQDCA